jgi:hypothetical protein
MMFCFFFPWTCCVICSSTTDSSWIVLSMIQRLSVNVVNSCWLTGWLFYSVNNILNVFVYTKWSFPWRFLRDAASKIQDKDRDSYANFHLPRSQGTRPLLVKAMRLIITLFKTL